MKKLLIFLSFLLNTCYTYSQPGTWTWMRGDSIDGAYGNFGIQGVPSPLNVPPALYEPAEFTDLQGNFWLFGGVASNPSTGPLREFNDLWKYDPASNEWTWMKGQGMLNSPGNLGVKGVPAITNLPPCLGWGAASWVDLNGDFWIYGGASGGNPINLLWKYNIATNTWTWIHGSGGSGTPVYGILGIADSLNTPGARYECNAAWVDQANNLWLFGGYFNSSMHNDLWKYDPLINQWTWMSGSNIANQAGIYGIQGIPSSTNVPGARMAYCHWTDAAGNFWFFAGGDDNGFCFNDMWRFNPLTSEWTWMSGTNLINDVGVFGPQGVSSVSYLPPSRTENRAFWTDACGNFWLYGSGRYESFLFCSGDLWMFNPPSLEWTFVSGDSVPVPLPVYGTNGISSASNKPGPRFGTIGWRNGMNLFLFGGRVNVWPPRNDLWKFEMVPYVPLNTSIQANTDTVCAGDTIQLLASINAGSYLSYSWNGGMGAFLDSTNLNTSYISNNSFSGQDWLIFKIIGTCGDTVYDSLLVIIDTGNTVTITASGPVTFCQGDSVTLTASGLSNYNWNTGTTTSSLTVISPGIYAVTGSNACGIDMDSINITVLNDNAIAMISSGPDTFCLGDSVILSVINGGSSFLWSNGNTTSSTTILTSGSYSVTVTGQCDTIHFSRQILVNAPPVLSVALSDSVLCNGDSAIIVASGGTGYVWSNGLTTSSISVTTGGSYSVISANACGTDSGFATITANIIQAAFITDKDSGNVPLIVQFTNQSTGATFYYWQFENNSQSNAVNPAHTYLSPGTYQVLLVAQDANGCIDTAFGIIIVGEDSTTLVVPNIFSPNADSYNQFFNVNGTGIKSVSGIIYNRWGTEIANWHSLDGGWDGITKNGDEAPEGTYYYLITVTFVTNEVINKKGALTLVR